MKPQTHDEWFKTVDSPGNRLDYLLTLMGWDASHEATKESAVLIVKSYLTDDPTCNTLCASINTLCESIAEDIGKL